MRRCLPFLLAISPACKVKDPPPVTEAWTDNFDHETFGTIYYRSGPGYEVTDGTLSAKCAHNHPLWLRKKLPRDVRIELDCWSTEPRGDLKVEVFGDGHSFDPDGGAYTATGYEVIFGGWYNTKSIIARLDEHGKDVVARVDPKVVPNQHYHWKIERRGKTITWFVDDMQKPFLEFVDEHPLEGMGHDYFGFNNWETDTWFDNLAVTPL
ncbi:MAG: hypothetical protein JWO36_1901 [Myxococcales bacterium]|nr:hypothetical protein [Myxococcales bacterium]